MTMVEVKPGTWLRSGIPLMLVAPEADTPTTCPQCGGDRWVVQPDAKVECNGCGLQGSVQ